MRSVVSGNAIMRPTKPRREPHTESERRRIAGFRFIAFPMIFGVNSMSAIIWTTMKTAKAEANIIQKFWPVSALFNKARKMVGINAIVWSDALSHWCMLKARISVNVTMGQRIKTREENHLARESNSTTALTTCDNLEWLANNNKRPLIRAIMGQLATVGERQGLILHKFGVKES